MDNIGQLRCINDIYTGKVPFTWEQFLKCKVVIFGYIKRTVGVKGQKIYRASFIRENDKLKNLKSRYSYTPPELAEKGRCNVKGYPVFYGASNFLGAIQEAIIAQKNPNILKDYNYEIYVSEWEILEPKKYFVYDTRNNLQINLGNQKVLFDSIYQNLINKIFTSKQGHDISSNLSFMLMNGSKQAGREPGRLYPPPGVENCKFIFYPSVARNGKFINLAIHPSIIDENIISLVKIFKVGMPSIKDDLIKCPKEIPFPLLKESLSSIIFDLLINSERLSFEFLKVGVLSENDGDNISWRDPVKTDYEYI